jgi:hypothetical protein
MKQSLFQTSRAVRRGSLLAGVVVGCIALGVVFSHAPPPRPILVLAGPYHPPARRAAWPSRWIPAKPSWGWLWRLKEWVFGRRKPIDLGVAIYEFKAAPESVLAGLALGEPELTHTNGLRIWRLGDAKLDALRRRLRDSPDSRLLGSPRCSTAERIQCSLFLGESFPVNGAMQRVGLMIDFYPRVRRDATDLTSGIVLSEAVANLPGTTAEAPSSGNISILTNLAVATRIQIPKGQGVFLLKARPDAAGPRRIGVIISANQPRAKSVQSPKSKVRRGAESASALGESPSRNNLCRLTGSFGGWRRCSHLIPTDREGYARCSRLVCTKNPSPPT